MDDAKWRAFRCAAVRKRDDRLRGSRRSNFKGELAVKNLSIFVFYEPCNRQSCKEENERL